MNGDPSHVASAGFLKEFLPLPFFSCFNGYSISLVSHKSELFTECVAVYL